MRGGKKATQFRFGHRAGFTLVEALLASTIMAIVSASAMLPLLAAEQQRQGADRLKYAVELGRAMMEEVLARPVVSSLIPDSIPGPSGIETTRKGFLNADAFHGYSEPVGVVMDMTGNVVADPAFAGYWRTVTAGYVTFPGQMPGDLNGLLLVRVNVFYDTELMATFSQLVAKEG